ncbi:SusD/RagB family nutrient-binding outer membrane lipoprotein [Deminuibacter soli]|nr:SusD/RagB family nutrient-binding outer membrane lipoprotein [Deminuibacter soli]
MFNRNSTTYILAAALAISLLDTACSKKIDEAYLNPNAQVVEPIEQLLPSVIANFTAGSSAANSGNGTAGDAREIGRYIQYWAQNTNNYQYDRMGGTNGGNGGILGYTWTMHYAAVGQNLNQIINWGSQQQKWDYVGAAWAIRAWSWLTLGDEYGNVILKEAFDNSRTQFDYDSLSMVYDTVRVTAQRALTFLNQAGTGISANLAIGDKYFNNGDLDKWKKFAYGVLARSFHHLSNKSTYQADSVIKYCDLAMSVNNDNCIQTFENSNVSGTMNYFGPTRGNVGSIRQTVFIADLLSGNNPLFPGIQDPRIYYLIRENANGTFKGISPVKGAAASTGLATNDLPTNFWGSTYTSTTATDDKNARFIFRNQAPFPVMTACEMQFIKAEAQFIKGDKAGALATYRNAIQLHIDMLKNDYATNVPANGLITDAAENAYLNNTAIVPETADKLTLSHIMLQKYIALYGWNAHETWVDMRRYHYIDKDANGNQVYTGWVPLAVTDIYPDNNGKYVYRARPQNTSEYLYNIIAVTAMGGTATDYCTHECWFSMK